MTDDRTDTFDLSEVKIRLVKPADHAAVLKLYDESRSEGLLRPNDTGCDLHHLEETYLSDDGGSGFWVADHKGMIVGMIGVRRLDPHTAEVCRLRVAGTHRRRGIGSRLMEHAVRFCQRHSYLKVKLDVRIERAPAIAMFEKFGFSLARSRDVEGHRMLDFYLDLYREPHESS